LLGNSDADDIFPRAGYRRLAGKAQRVYALYGAEEKFRIHETSGPHKDTPELHLGINTWMNRWLKDDTTSEVKPDLEKRLKPQQLRVFEKLPERRLNETVQETFVPVARLDLPGDPAAAKEWWAKTRDGLMTALKTKVFGGWAANPPPLGAKVAADVTEDGIRLRAIDFTSETGVELRMWVKTLPKMEKPAEVMLSVLDDGSWQSWCARLGPAFADALQLTHKPERYTRMIEPSRDAMEVQNRAFAAVAPRGVGPTQWAEPFSRDDAMIRRRFPLIGQTLDGQRVWDVRRAVAALRSLPDMKDVPLALAGEGETAGLALYAGLFEPAVASFDLWNLPSSHREGPIFLNVLRYLDAPQAVALAAPRPVTLHVKTAAERDAWDWPARLATSLGEPSLTVKVVGK
jgi:hypothetical protein